MDTLTQLNLIQLWDWTWRHNASLHWHQHFNRPFCSRTHIFRRNDSIGRVSVLSNSKCAVTSRSFSKRDKVYRLHRLWICTVKQSQSGPRPRCIMGDAQKVYLHRHIRMFYWNCTTKIINILLPLYFFSAVDFPTPKAEPITVFRAHYVGNAFVPKHGGKTNPFHFSGGVCKYFRICMQVAAAVACRSWSIQWNILIF